MLVLAAVPDPVLKLGRAGRFVIRHTGETLVPYGPEPLWSTLRCCPTHAAFPSMLMGEWQLPATSLGDGGSLFARRDNDDQLCGFVAVQTDAADRSMRARGPAPRGRGCHQCLRDDGCQSLSPTAIAKCFPRDDAGRLHSRYSEALPDWPADRLRQFREADGSSEPG